MMMLGVEAGVGAVCGLGMELAARLQQIRMVDKLPIAGGEG